MSTLRDIIEDIERLDDEDVIFAKPEWTPDSDAAIFRLTADFRSPPEAVSAGYAYFLEISTVREILEEFSAKPLASLEERCARLIEYATCDA